MWTAPGPVFGPVSVVQPTPISVFIAAKVGSASARVLLERPQSQNDATLPPP